MEIKILEESKNKIIVNIEGEGHTFCNVLKKELWNDKHVTAAGYSISHPLVGIPEIIVETDGKKKAKTVLMEAASRLQKQTDKLKKEFSKVLK